MKFKLKRSSRTKNIKRHPTNTISRQSSIYNYRSSRNETNRPYNREDEPGDKTMPSKRSYLKYILLAAVIISLGYLLMLAPSAKVNLSGNSAIKRNGQVYEDVINRHLRQNASSYTKLTFDSEKLSKSIESEFPEVTEVKIALPLFNRHPKVEIVFSEPSVLMRVFGDDTYILDGQGRAIVKESEASNRIIINQLTHINDTSSQQVVLGKPALTEQQMNFIDETIRQAKSKKLAVEVINLAGGASQLNVKYKDVEYLVKYSFFANPRQSSGAYFAMRDKLNHDKKTPKEYIDLRIPERAYIK
jgi:cell division septal protein FtsQ